ncbi:hypothetical protein [Streptomyces sp. AM 2-1-1]|uniref:hypothetical protein n=1 Tax=Streptomyces sp. AM 2-1-1 TaxID=3028709 RepID=UPI0023B913E3|nr:hypothetical protein [Streptomyces sp. AM 2-1-1]WEH40771.1 hypothetical protein PZB77_15370 [Streptomyces sp. AM 2-1-1]
MTTTCTTTATERHLFTVARDWRDLREALATRGTTWPPTMGIGLLSAHQSEDEAEAATWRAEALRSLERSPDQPGWTAAPLRLDVLDTMVTVEAGLLELADQTAAAIQHAPITPAPPRRSWPDDPRARRSAEADDRRRNQLALRQGKDPRRWRYTGAQRTAPLAALWLLARTQGVRGPWRPLTEAEQHRIDTVARTSAGLVERALDTADGRVRLAAPCPECGGPLDLHGGGGAAPVARCTACGRTWSP